MTRSGRRSESLGPDVPDAWPESGNGRALLAQQELHSQRGGWSNKSRARLTVTGTKNDRDVATALRQVI